MLPKRPCQPLGFFPSICCFRLSAAAVCLSMMINLTSAVCWLTDSSKAGAWLETLAFSPTSLIFFKRSDTMHSFVSSRFVKEPQHDSQTVSNSFFLCDCESGAQLLFVLVYLLQNRLTHNKQCFLSRQRMPEHHHQGCGLHWWCLHHGKGGKIFLNVKFSVMF